LQQAEQRFSENITRNRELRTEIESLNKQRETFDQVSPMQVFCRGNIGFFGDMMPC
jgi:hypothetical protein